MWSSEDGECFDDMNAQVWQVPQLKAARCGFVTVPTHPDSPSSRHVASGVHVPDGAYSAASYRRVPGHPQAYFNVAMNQQSENPKAADVDAPADSSALTTPSDDVAEDTPGGVTATHARSQLERSPSGYVQQFMDRAWTKTSV